MLDPFCHDTLHIKSNTLFISFKKISNLQVTFTVHELGRIRGSVNTSIGNNEGSVMITAETPNILGRGERINAQYSYGTKSNHINISAIKPFFDSRHQKV